MSRTVVITETCDGRVPLADRPEQTRPCGARLTAGSHSALNAALRKAGWSTRPGGKTLCRPCLLTGLGTERLPGDPQE